VRVALDTNILTYAEGVNGAERQLQAHSISSSACLTTRSSSRLKRLANSSTFSS
jgi:predicted nucleic acid-binding protein